MSLSPPTTIHPSNPAHPHHDTYVQVRERGLTDPANVGRMLAVVTAVGMGHSARQYGPHAAAILAGWEEYLGMPRDDRWSMDPPVPFTVTDAGREALGVVA